jgi:hypothetical protein
MNSITGSSTFKTEDVSSTLDSQSLHQACATLRQEIDRADQQIRAALYTAENVLRLAEKLHVKSGAGEEHVPISAANLPERPDLTKEQVLLVAETVYRSRQARGKYFAARMFGEPVWDMLTDLFIAELRGKQISTTSLCLASSVPQTTALRYINVMERERLIERYSSSADSRVVYVKLTPSTFDRAWHFFEDQSASLRWT